MQKEINLKGLFEVIKKRLLLILLITGITTIASGLYSLTSQGPPPVYQSSTSILLNSDEKDSIGTLEVVLRDRAVLNTVIEELGLDKTLDQLNNQLTFASEGSSKIIKIIVVDTNPELAAAIANSTANIFTKQVGSILGIYDTRIVSEAQVSNAPLSVGAESSLLKGIVFGLVGGLVIGIGLVLFLDSLDETIRSEREIEQFLDLPVIGSVSRMNNENTKNKPGQRAGLKKKRWKNGA